MKKILHSYSGLVLGTLVVIFLGTLLAFYLWAVNDLFAQLHIALAAPTGQSAQGFDLTNATRLDLRGLVSASDVSSIPTPVASPIPAPVIPASTTTSTTFTVATTSAAAPSSTAPVIATTTTATLPSSKLGQLPAR